MARVADPTELIRPAAKPGFCWVSISPGLERAADNACDHIVGEHLSIREIKRLCFVQGMLIGCEATNSLVDRGRINLTPGAPPVVEALRFDDIEPQESW